MQRFRSRQLRFVLVPLMAASLLSACTGWQIQNMAPSQVLAEKEPERVRLTLLDGSRIELHQPQVCEDEIVAGRERVPVDSVRYTETPTTFPIALVLLFVSVGVLGEVLKFRKGCC